MDDEFLLTRKILKIGYKISNSRDSDFQRCGITPGQWETLLFFDLNENATITDLKDHLNISHQAARNIVERLKDKKILNVERAAEDGRAKKIYLTDKGKDICCEVKKGGIRTGRNILSGFSDEEVEELKILLEKIYNNI